MSCRNQKWTEGRGNLGISLYDASLDCQPIGFSSGYEFYNILLLSFAWNFES